MSSKSRESVKLSSNNPLKFLNWVTGGGDRQFHRRTGSEASSNRTKRVKTRNRRHRHSTGTTSIPDSSTNTSVFNYRVVDVDDNHPISSNASAISDPTPVPVDDRVEDWYATMPTNTNSTSVNDDLGRDRRSLNNPNRRDLDRDREQPLPVPPPRRQEYSLLESARNLQQLHISVKFSLKDAPFPQPLPNNQPNIPRQVPTTPTFPDHLLYSSASGDPPSTLDRDLQTCLNAGATIEFLPIPPLLSPTSSQGVGWRCNECTDLFSNQTDLETHVDRSETHCSLCRVTFRCRNLLEDHIVECSQTMVAERRGRAGTVNVNGNVHGLGLGIGSEGGGRR